MQWMLQGYDSHSGILGVHKAEPGGGGPSEVQHGS